MQIALYANLFFYTKKKLDETFFPKNMNSSMESIKTITVKRLK